MESQLMGKLAAYTMLIRSDAKEDYSFSADICDALITLLPLLFFVTAADRLDSVARNGKAQLNANLTHIQYRNLVDSLLRIFHLVHILFVAL